MIHRVPSPSRSEFRPDTLGVRAVLFALFLGSWASGCTPVAVTTAEPEPAGPVAPAIEATDTPASRSEAADRGLAEARRHWEAGDAQAARDAARDIVQRFPSAAGSAEALAILAQAALATGAAEEAREASARYLALLDEDHPLYPGAVLLSARTLDATGELGGATATLIGLPVESPDTVLDAASDLLRRLVRNLDAGELIPQVEGAPRTHPLRGVAATELAVGMFLRGEEDEARVWAREALLGPLSSDDEALNRGVLGGSLDGVLGEALVLGAILPGSGVSPGLQEYGERVLEGIQVAVDEYQLALRRPIRLEVLDHQGDPEQAGVETQALESMGAIGAVGPLSANFLQVAAASRTSVMPIVSPFSSVPPDQAEGVYSLSGPDPGGSEEVARYAWDLGLERIAVLRPGTSSAEVDASAFRRVFEGLGGTVDREIVFDPSATFFQSEFEEVGGVLPDGLFLPLTPRDVRLVAPQFTYYGLDTLGIQVLGTSGWTDEDVVAEVDSRHTDGVIASTTRMSQDETESYRRFRVMYEERFQKSLRTNIPAFGYDAASILLQGLETGLTAPEDRLRSIGTVNDFPGATGHFSVVDGLINRLPQLVRIQNRELIYISSHIH